MNDMRIISPTFVLVEETDYAAVGRIDLKGFAQGKIIQMPDSFDVRKLFDLGDIVVLKQKWTKYLSMGENLYLVPIDNVMIAFTEDEIYDLTKEIKEND